MPTFTEKVITESDAAGLILKVTRETMPGVGHLPRHPFDVRDDAAVMFFNQFCADLDVGSMPSADVDKFIYRAFAKASVWMKARGQDPAYPYAEWA